MVASTKGIHLFKNIGNSNNWLEIEFCPPRGKIIGARIEVTQNGKLQIREVMGGKGTTTQDSLKQFFGFGKSLTPVDIFIRYADGSTARFEDVDLNQIFRINLE